MVANVAAFRLVRYSLEWEGRVVVVAEDCCVGWAAVEGGEICVQQSYAGGKLLHQCPIEAFFISSFRFAVVDDVDAGRLVRISYQLSWAG